jgi:hypothetical protein
VSCDTTDGAWLFNGWICCERCHFETLAVFGCTGRINAIVIYHKTMFMKKLPVFFLLAASVLVLSFWIESPCDSPLVGGHTGAPGETGCDGCHDGTPNAGPGTLTLNWSDTSGHYVPGQMYDAVVTLEQADRDKFGFVALALKDSGNATTGQFSIDDADRTRTFSDGPRKYVSHTPCGADAVPAGSLLWTFHWQAPATDVGAVTIYLAGLAANHNHATSGDDAYELALHLTPADSVASARCSFPYTRTPF